MSTLTFEAGTGPSQLQNQTDGPRKRRKRAPAAGAADDCFTCANRSVKCDRRRPYCSPCLEIGQDCAGYKTQLTWGVGVASRGKLRGLSLPVAGTKKVTEPKPPGKKKRTQPPSSTLPVQFAPETQSLPLSPMSASDAQLQARQGPSATSYPGYQHADTQAQYHDHVAGGSISSVTQPELLPSPVSPRIDTPLSNAPWPSAGSLPNQFSYGLPPVSPLPYSMPAQTNQYYDGALLPHQEFYGTPDSYSHADLAAQPLLNARSEYSLQQPPQNAYHSYDGFASSISTLPNSLADNHLIALQDDDEVEEIKREVSPMSDVLSVASSQLIYDMNINWSPFTGTNMIGKTSRMQYLIQYYAEVIAPVIVAFDSPTNPFRDQILKLAAKNDSLQHALSALAASNLRQRKESGALSTGKTLPARRSSQAHLSLTSDSSHQAPIIPARDQKREEAYHKYHAVQSLNSALANPALRKDDAVLATLLVLCLFHVCDSGIARFQTQFAGVKKLLTLRKNEQRGDDASTKWMTRLFLWFDAMAATVNDREGQFDNQNLESVAFSDEEWSYETLAGVDGRLFKTISQLGRLNILSQGKDVEVNTTLVSRPTPCMSTSLPNGAADLNAFDGNGWLRIVEDENFFHSQTVHFPDLPYDQRSHSGLPSGSEGTGNQRQMSEQFWREWLDIRQQLQTWNLDSLLYEAPTHPNGQHLTEDQRLDIGNISNAFRYSALLYTERLGSPDLPSSDEKFQYWVRRSLHHIRCVRSDVYLLWPLFITGSECVHEEGRNVIRERCEDIQKDSGFVNNASCLALLEKVWRIVPTVSSDTTQSANLAGTAAVGAGTSTSAGSSSNANADIAPFTNMKTGSNLNETSPSLSFIDPNDTSLLQQQHQQQQPKVEGKESNVRGFRFRDVMSAEGNDGEWIVV